MPPRSLILIPTELERRRMPELSRRDCHLCGFGPIAAAARTARLLQSGRFDRVILAGIAGSFDVERFPLATALTFGSVTLDGIGVGRHSDSGIDALGFSHTEANDGQPIGDRIALADASDAQLLTVCSASGDEDDAEHRRRRFEGVACEDMEGFGVALACRMAGILLTIVRGVSNRVGDRATQSWRIDDALAESERLVLERLEAPAR